MKVRAEHRASCRYRTNSACRIGLLDGGRLLLHRARLLDISVSGGRIYSPIRVNEGTVLQLTIDSHDAATIYARVVRCSELADGRHILGLSVVDGSLPYDLFCDLAFRAAPPPDEPEMELKRAPAPQPPCFQELSLELPCTVEDVRRSFRELAKTAHPDHGGNMELFIRLRAAYYDAVEYLQASGVE